MCLLTAEVRWFWLGSVPPDFLRWFTSNDPLWCCAATAERREDEYLRDTQTTLGIKRRGDTVEIKGFIAKPDTVFSFAMCRSQIEIWGKWSSAALQLSGAPLLRLQKERLLRRFRKEAGQLVEVSARDEQKMAIES